jgi:signal recognition particle subunit SRP54
MFETLTRGFRAAKQKLSGKAELTPEVVDDALRDVRLSLLEADVEFKVVKAFLDRVKEKALGQTVELRATSSAHGTLRVTPEQHFVKICQDELVALMGPVDTTLRTAKRGPTGIMMVGLQGSGKTTTCGKLARYLEKKHKKPCLVAADVYRPAAIQQLKVIGEKLGMPVYAEEASKNPVEICQHAVEWAHTSGRDTIIFDTAGRLAIDEPLMQELADIDKAVQPANIFLVCDAMIGQSAVETAKSFNERLNLDGMILTKLDGDARGGAALSIKEVTGKPIKFLGIGESLDKIEEFRPEGLASRILGMGDIVGLIQEFEEVVDAEKAEKDAVRMLKGKFDMSDFLEQIRIIQKMGSLKDIFEKMPFFPDGMPDGVQLDDKELVKIEAMISSMTMEERRYPERFITVGWQEFMTGGKAKKKRALDFAQNRIRRVATGAGRKEHEVKELVNKFGMMRQMMMEIGASTGLLGKLPGFKQVAQMRKLAGIDVNQLMGLTASARGAAERAGGFRPPVRSEDRAREKAKRKAARKARKRNKRR